MRNLFSGGINDGPSWQPGIWAGSLILLSLAISVGFACVTPIAAFATFATLIFPRNTALWIVTGVWLANQVAGYTILNYPWDLHSFAWGGAIGVASLLAACAARFAMGRISGASLMAQSMLCLLSAFAAYEVTLFAVALFVLGGVGAFTPSIVWQVLAVNVVMLCALHAMHWIIVTSRPFLLPQEAR